MYVNDPDGLDIIREASPAMHRTSNADNRAAPMTTSGMKSTDPNVLTDLRPESRQIGAGSVRELVDA